MVSYEFNAGEKSIIFKTDETSIKYYLTDVTIKDLYENLIDALRVGNDTPLCKRTKSPYRFVIVLNNNGIYVPRDLVAKLTNDLRPHIKD